MVLHYWLISAASAAVPPSTEAMLIRLESLRSDPAQMAPFVADANAEVRARSAEALGRLRDARSVASLTDLVRDPVPSVRAAAAHAMGQTPGTRSALLEQLQAERTPHVRQRLIRAVGMQGNAWDIDLLLELIEQPVLTHHDVGEVSAAANALGQMAIRGIDTVRIDRVVLTLVQQTKSVDASIRFNTAFALARIAPTSGPPRVQAALIDAAMSESNADVKALLVRAIARLPDAHAVLNRTRHHPSPTVRIATARASLPAKWTDVTAMMDDESPAVSLAAIEAVGQMPSLDRIALLGPIVNRGMKHRSPTDGSAAIHPDLAKAVGALTALDIPKAWWETDTARYTRVQAGLLPSLSMYMSEDQDPIIRAAATAIATDPENLYRLAVSDPMNTVRMAAAQRILGDRISYNRAISLLNAEDPMVLAAVADWLRDQPNAKAEAALVVLAQRTEEPSLVHSAVMALASLTYRKPARKRASGGATALLPSLLAHKDPSIRAAGLELAKAAGSWPKFFEYNPEPVSPAAISEIRSAVISTARGNIVVDLHPEHAPLTVENFARLADAGFYNDVPFHRVIADFVAQGGDPRGDGWGGAGLTVPDEVNATPYTAGTLGMAINGRDTGSSQWFITLAPQPHLNDRYTAFGQVTQGMNVARSLLPGDRISSVSIERVTGPEERAADERDRAQRLLAKLEAEEILRQGAERRKAGKRSKPAAKKSQDKSPDKPRKRKRRDNPPPSEPIDSGPEDPEEDSGDPDMPDSFEKPEEDDPLLEGEKVDIIDPTEED
ncbi:MAG: peptidylprolyl isomerase [Myxococcota bacterium]|nr:peptidylprolyl isomerase [Myxococcota bacterium]